MPRIKKLFAVLGAVGVLFGLSASSALAFNSGTPPGPPATSGGRGALVCHQTDPPKGGDLVFNSNGIHENGPNPPSECNFPE
jgi:hypothetical protein